MISTAAASIVGCENCPAALFDHASHGGDGGVDLALLQPQERHARGRLSSVLAGRPVRPLGVGQVTSQTVELALLVEGEPERRMGRLGQTLPGPLDLRHRLRPLTVCLQHLRPVHEALAAVRHEIGLGDAPAVRAPRSTRPPVAGPSRPCTPR